MLSTIVGIIGAVLTGVFAWAVNLNSRVSVLEADKVSLKELIEEKFKGVNTQFEGVNLQLVDIKEQLREVSK